MQLFPRVGLFVHFVGKHFRLRKLGRSINRIAQITLTGKVLIIAGLLDVCWLTTPSPV